METQATPPADAGPPFVVEGTRENFEREVVERSREVPVVVDFWAEWCGPCRALGPVLENLATEYNGRFALVKIDIDAHPDLAGAFQVQSIPAVYAVRDARPVDAFVGALPEPMVRQWIEGLMPTPAQTLLREAAELEETEPALAEVRYREALELTPGDHDAQTGLARVLVRQGRFDEAREIVQSLEGHGYFDNAVEAVKAEIELKEQAKESGGVETARQALAANPPDPTLRLKLAEALAAAGSFEESLEISLGLVEEHHKDVSDQARQAMIHVFQLLPAGSELADEYRRRLSAALY